MMMKTKVLPRPLCRWLVACLFAVALCGPAAAAFPDRPIVLIVPAIKEPIAAMPNAAPALPCFAIW